MKKINQQKKHLPRFQGGVLKTSLMVLFMICFFSFKSQATHFRYGNLSWSRDIVNPLKINFKLTESWRRGFPWNQYEASNPLNPVTGQQISFNGNFPLNLGDGASVNVILTITAISVADDWI